MAILWFYYIAVLELALEFEHNSHLGVDVSTTRGQCAWGQPQSAP